MTSGCLAISAIAHQPLYTVAAETMRPAEHSDERVAVATE